FTRTISAVSKPFDAETRLNAARFLSNSPSVPEKKNERPTAELQLPYFLLFASGLGSSRVTRPSRISQNPHPTTERNHHSLVLPAAAEGAVEADKTLILGTLILCQGELGRKEGALSVQYLQVRGSSAPVAHVGKPDGFRQIGNRILLAHADLMKLFVTDER